MSGGAGSAAGGGEASFAARILAWYDRHGRHDLPWQRPATPYRVWISEVMLQQTRVETVRPYFLRFIERFPDGVALAAAPIDEVLAHWSGLGYYARARNLHRAATAVVADHGGELPDDLAALQALPGIGRSTAAAIQSLARGRHHAILDGNVKRVLARHAGIAGWPGRTAVQRQLWCEAEARTPHARVAAYNQAMMDLGASVCARQPRCGECPVAADCHARLAGATASLPEPRPRRERPVREALVLLLVRARDGCILLERRPAYGIWGGLWSLPEFDSHEALRSWLAARGLYGQTESLAPVEHGFTHFQYRMYPQRVLMPAAAGSAPVTGSMAPGADGAGVEGMEGIREGAEFAWTRAGEPPGGVPAPIARLLTASAPADAV